MPETIIESVLKEKLDVSLLINWLNNECIEDTPEDCILFCCNKNEFVAYFLSYLRSQTDSILQTNSNALQILQHQSTPEKILSSQRNHKRSISDPTSENDRTMESLSVKTDKQSRSHQSPSKDRKKTGRKVKTKLFPEDRSREQNQSLSSDESRLSIGVDRLALSSTPIKNGLKVNEYPNLPLTSPVTPHSRSFNREHQERCDTPRFNHRYSRSQDKNLSLGDFLINVQPKSSKKKKSGKNVSNESDSVKSELDLSNSDIFPVIGAKSNSLRSERKRIKPTNLDGSMSQKSFSLNSFNSECFQQPSPLALEDNIAFKHQKFQPKEQANNFETERNILKQERHKLMEKFNLNASTSPKNVTPQIKIIQKDSVDKTQSYIKADHCNVMFKEKLDVLIDIYDVLLKNNLILSVNTEIYFLISILLSKQYEDDYRNVECHLSDNISDFLLKSLHNSTYFAVKSLWNQRAVLEVILDKSSLKILGENKKVRSFYPDLAKFLLNSYCFKCEAESSQEKRNVSEGTSSNGVICFNLETDNADNFPSILSFQNFKKQRDMFYEILRWYQDNQPSGCSRTTLRTRIKALVSSGPAAANHAHLAALFTAHMLAECLPGNAQESRLSKLQRRLTCPAAPESHRMPRFTDKEMFYKEFVMYTENEAFKVHLRDALASQIVSLDSTPLAAEDRSNSSNTDISKEYLQLSNKLRLLGKFLGYLTSLPYSQVSIDLILKTGASIGAGQSEQNYTAPKEKVLENNIALRNYSQPCIDLKGILTAAYQNGRLSVSLPWIVHYISMLDYTSLRINYYKDLLRILFYIYTQKLKSHKAKHLKRNTLIFFKSTLGWLFDLPHVPHELFYEKVDLKLGVASDMGVDCCDIIDESILFDLCPYLREVNVLLSTCRVSQDQKEMGSYRHITPVSLGLNPEDRMRNKEKELQARLEEEFLKSQPSSTRRVLELVMERVTSGAVREVSAHTLADARKHVREQAARLVRARGADDTSSLLQALQALYAEHLQQLRARALEAGTSCIQRRTSGALCALLPTAPRPLHAVAVRGCLNRLGRWLNDNWTNTAILCKDIEEEMKTLIAIGDMVTVGGQKATVDVAAMTLPAAEFDATHVSAAAVVISLKEQVCRLLDHEELTTDVTSLLAACAACCAPGNLFGRPPTRRAVMQLSVDFCVVYVSRKPKEVNDSFLNKLAGIWNVCCPDRKRNYPQEIGLPERRAELSPQLRNFEDDDRAPTPVTDDEDNGKCVIIVTNGVEVDITVGSETTVRRETTDESKSDYRSPTTTTTDFRIPTTNKTGFRSPTTKTTDFRSPTKTARSFSRGNVTTESNTTVNSVMDSKIEETNNELLEFFDRVLCPRNIVLLGSSKCKASDVWEALATVLVFLLKNDYLSEDSLTEQCLAVYRQDWPQSTLESLSTCMKSVSSRWSRSSTGKFTLFLDFLAEYCGDMDYEPVDCHDSI